MKTIKDIRMWLYSLFRPRRRKPVAVKPIVRRSAVTIGGRRFWRNQLVGKSEVELQNYFVRKGLLLSEEEITEVHQFINNKIVKENGKA